MEYPPECLVAGAAGSNLPGMLSVGTTEKKSRARLPLRERCN
jgi:hypothetical protein